MSEPTDPNSQDPTQRHDAPGEGDPRPEKASSGSRERDLIRAALRQADDRSGEGPVPGGVDSVVPGHEIIREIHRGGQGVVYLAVQGSTKRKVAVKVLYDSAIGGSSGKARFEREVQILARLNHPNIVKVHDSGKTPAGSVYYVMEYVSGTPLDAFIASKPDLAVESALRLFQGMCAGIEAAHLRGIIHRDLKPANILVNDEGQPIVVDFGLAKMAAGEGGSDENDESMRSMTMTGQFVGSLPWASPEQAQGSPDAIDVRTDVYSLGVILYQLLTGGKFPYQVVGKMLDVLEHILHTAPARPSTLRRQINDEVETIVLKSLNKERGRRYQSAGELKRDVERYLNGEPIEAKRDSTVYVISKAVRKYKKTVAVAGAFLVLIVVFGVTMGLMAARESSLRATAENATIEADRAREEAEKQRDNAEYNLSQMRRFTGMLVYDLYDELEDTRGTTEVRRRMIEGASTYLESVRAEASVDPTYEIEVADVSMRAGDLLGGRDAQKLGETERARALFDRAMQINQSRVDADPTDAGARLALGESLTRVAWLALVDREFNEAVRLHERARGQYREADRLAGDDQALALRGRDALAEADLIVATTLYTQALGEDDADTQARLIDTSLELARSAVDTWRLRALDGSPEATRRWAASLTALTEVRIGHARRHMGLASASRQADDLDAVRASLERAVEAFGAAEDIARRSVERWEPLADDSTSSSDRVGLAKALHAAGLARTWSGRAREQLAEWSGVSSAAAEAERDHEAALNLYRRGLSVAEQAVADDPMSLSARRLKSTLLNKVQRELARAGRVEEAEAAARASLDARRLIHTDDPTAQHERDLALGSYSLGRLLRFRAERLEGPARIDTLRGAEAALQEAVERYTSLGNEARSLRVATRSLAEVRELLGADALGPP